MEKIEPITIRYLNYHKPLCLIYNPNSGRRKNIILRIQDRLTIEKIRFKLLITNRANDTFLLGNTLDLTKYSALIAVGGDGSVSEVVSGMLSREDGKRLPVGCIPNGSGNYLCLELGIFDVDGALDTIVARCTAKFNVIECLADLENPQDALKGIEGFKHRKHALLKAWTVPFYSRFLTAATPLKPFVGGLAYGLSFLHYFCCCCCVRKWREKYRFKIDGKRLVNGADELFTTDSLVIDMAQTSVRSSLNGGYAVAIWWNLKSAVNFSQIFCRYRKRHNWPFD